MNNGIILVLILLMFVFRCCGTPVHKTETVNPTSLIEDQIENEEPGTDPAETISPAETDATVATPEATPAAVTSDTPSAEPTAAAPQDDYEGPLFGEPDTDF